MNIREGNLVTDWQMVRPGLENICARQECDYIPEDIYMMIKSGRGTLYVNSERDSFMVLQRTMNQRTGERGAHMVVVFVAGGRDAESFLQETEDIARAAGCSYLEMDSSRRGFERSDWVKVRTVYRRAI